MSTVSSKEPDLTERIKKIGATIIITLLGIGMAVTFLPGAGVEDVTNAFRSGNFAGTYDGDPITQSDYVYAEQGCLMALQGLRFAQFRVPDCIRDLYVKPAIGKNVGLGASKESVEKALIDQVNLQHAQMLATVKDPEDRMTKLQIHEQERRRFPITYRIRSTARSVVERSLTMGYPYPTRAIEAESKAGGVRMDIRYIRYNDAELLRGMGKTIKITEDEIRKTYDEEQKKLAKDKRKPYKVQKEFVRNRILAKRKQEALKTIKADIAKVDRKAGLNAISKALKVAPLSVRGITLANLSKVQPRKNLPQVNLALPEFLSNLDARKNVNYVGPIRDGAFTVYIEASNIRVAKPAKQDEKKLKARVDREGQTLAFQLLNYMARQEASRGKFRVYPRPRQR